MKIAMIPGAVVLTVPGPVCVVIEWMCIIHLSSRAYTHYLWSFIPRQSRDVPLKQPPGNGQNGNDVCQLKIPVNQLHTRSCWEHLIKVFMENLPCDLSLIRNTLRQTILETEECVKCMEMCRSVCLLQSMTCSISFSAAGLCSKSLLEVRVVKSRSSEQYKIGLYRVVNLTAFSETVVHEHDVSLNYPAMGYRNPFLMKTHSVFKWFAS